MLFRLAEFSIHLTVLRLRAQIRAAPITTAPVAESQTTGLRR
jgi:hypothetical protein